MLGPGKRAKGVAFVLTGLTVANVVGVPLGTYLGQQVGWRAAFMVVDGDLRRSRRSASRSSCPQHPGDPGRTLRAELKVFRIGQVWLALGVGAIGFGGFFAVYSYVAPMVTEIAGSPEWAVPIVLVVMGLGMTIGNLVGGRLADVDLKRTLVGGLSRSRSCSRSLALTAQWIWASAFFVFATGFVSSVLSPTIQTRLMDVAQDNQSIAAALNHSALNIGNSLGAFLGGVGDRGRAGASSPRRGSAWPSPLGGLVHRRVRASLLERSRVVAV